MFDKTRERIQKLEEDHDSVRAAHQHFTTHREKYLVVTAVGVTYVVTKRYGGSPDVVQSFTNSTDNVAIVVNRSKNVEIINKYLNVRNYNAVPTRCVETGMEWSSQVEAAEAMKIPQSVISQHINGKFPHAHGFHFERV